MRLLLIFLIHDHWPMTVLWSWPWYPMFHFQNWIIQLSEMYTELKRLEKQIAYDSEEVELKDQLAWARVHVSERESTTLLEQIAKKEEVVKLFNWNRIWWLCFGSSKIHIICSQFIKKTFLRIWRNPRRRWKRWRVLSKTWRQKSNKKLKSYNESETGNKPTFLFNFFNKKNYFSFV